MPLTSADLVALLDLEPAGVDRFVGRSPDMGWARVYGGQVIAQALVAAQRTVPGRSPHSLHAYFLLGGDPAEPILFEVERVRDGRSFSTRRVSASQRGEPIFVLAASFQIAEDGPEHQAPAPDGAAAGTDRRSRGGARRDARTGAQAPASAVRSHPSDRVPPDRICGATRPCAPAKRAPPSNRCGFASAADFPTTR